MKLDLSKIASVAAEAAPEKRITAERTERITKREVKPGSDIEKVNRAIRKVPQIMSRTNLDRSGKTVTMALGDTTITLDFMTGRFKIT